MTSSKPTTEEVRQSIRDEFTDYMRKLGLAAPSFVPTSSPATHGASNATGPSASFIPALPVSVANTLWTGGDGNDHFPRNFQA